MINTKKILITGGPGAGKTSIINELEKRNFNCEHEIVRSLTIEGKKKRKRSSISKRSIKIH